MDISVTDAKAQLTELVRRAEAGDEIVLTRHGRPAVRLEPIRRVPRLQDREGIIDRLCQSAAAKSGGGACAADSQDFLYGDDGLPR